MKKITTIAVITASLAYYICAAVLLAQAQTVSTGSIILAAGATTGKAGGTTIPVAPLEVTENATDTVVETLNQRVTAYASVPNETDDTPFTTADGTHVYDGEAASNILPFGTRIEIPALFGDKIFTIHDRMSTRIKNTVDIWMPSVQQAFLFGMARATILVLGSGSSTGQLLSLR